MADLIGVPLDGYSMRIEAMALEPIRPLIGPAIALAAGAVFALLSGGCSVLRVPAARRP